MGGVVDDAEHNSAGRVPERPLKVAANVACALREPSALLAFAQVLTRASAAFRLFNMTPMLA
jgi:hypothetical protein